MVTKKELRHYGLFFTGQNIFYFFIANFVHNYFTDVVGIAAGTVAVIFLIARIWDSVNDPLFGVIVDRSRMKSGRYKPWLKISAWLLPIFTIAIFLAPVGWTLAARTVFVTIMYVLWGLSFTTTDVPIYSLSVAMTSNTLERTSLIARGRLFSVLGILIVMLLTVPLTNIFTNITENPNMAWLIVAVLMSGFAMTLLRPISKSAQERNVDQSSTPISLKAILKYVTKNKQMLWFFSASILAALTNTTVIMTLYFVTVNLGNSNLFVLIVIVSMIGSPIVSATLPKLVKKFDKFHIFMFGLGVTIITSILIFFVGYEGSSFVPFLFLSAIRGFGFSCFTVMSFMFTADCIEYGTFASGERAEGVTFSLQTFTTKLTGAVTGFMAMGLLGWVFGYQSAYHVDGLLVTPVQTELAQQGIWFMFSAFPAFGAILAFIMLAFLYKLRDKDVQIMTDANAGKISREEAETMLSRKY